MRKRGSASPSFETLYSLCRHIPFQPGEMLRCKGQHYDNMFIIIEGEVEVYLEVGDIIRKIAALAGSPIGEIGFLRGCPATATVVATMPTQALLIDDGVLARLEHDHPADAIALMRYLAGTAEERTSFNLTFAATANPGSNSGIEVLLCRNPAMLQSAQRLRYEVYCQELERRSPFADHDRKIISDELDRFGITFIAVEAGEVIGTLRGNCSVDGPLGMLQDLYGMTASDNHPHATAICTKFVVKKSKRGGPAAMKLIAAMVRYGHGREIKECYIDSVPKLVPYYKALGFDISGERFLHRENGFSYPMALNLSKHGHRLAREPGSRAYLSLFLKAQAIRMLDAVRGRSATA